MSEARFKVEGGKIYISYIDLMGKPKKPQRPKKKKKEKKQFSRQPIFIATKTENESCSAAALNDPF